LTLAALYDKSKYDLLCCQQIHPLHICPWLLTVFTLSHLIMPAAISAETVDPVKMVEAFEAAGGKFEGYRRSGAKGICATGEFVGSTEGRTLSSASVFSGQKNSCDRSLFCRRRQPQGSRQCQEPTQYGAAVQPSRR